MELVALEDLNKARKSKDYGVWRRACVLTTIIALVMVDSGILWHLSATKLGFTAAALCSAVAFVALAGAAMWLCYRAGYLR